MLTFLFLFLSFGQLGLFGIGGPAAAQVVIEHETITLHHWFTPEQMADVLTLCRALPGGSGLNAATICGQAAAPEAASWSLSAMLSLVAVSALCLSAVFWTWLINRLMQHAPSQTVVHCVLTLLRPLIPGLIAAAALLMLTSENFGSIQTSPWHFWISVFLAASTALGICVYKFNATFMVVLCGLAGMILL